MGNELRNRVRGDRGVHGHDIGDADDAGDRRNVADEIEVEFLVERGIDRVCRSNQKKCVAISRKRTTASVPILLPPPGRFSVTNG